MLTLESLIEEEVGAEALNRAVFNAIDCDNEGEVTIREMTEHMRLLGQDVNPDDIFAAIHEVGRWRRGEERALGPRCASVRRCL